MPPKADAKKAPAKGGKAAKSAPKTKKIVIREAPAVLRKKRKSKFRANLVKALNNYSNVLVCNIDNVGSNQLQVLRKQLRSTDSVMLVGKNTVVRPVIREVAKTTNPKVEALVDYARNNVAFVFTNSSDLSGLRDVITAAKIPAGAKSGIIAPIDVFIPAGPTALDPGQTSFFQALNIATKITRGAIEIINPVHLIKVGDRVSASAVVLLNRLNIKPFFYGITLVKVYEDGFVYDGSVLDISKKEIYNKFVSAVEKIRFISLALKETNALTIRNSIVKAHNILVKMVLGMDYSFPTAQGLRSQFGLASPFAEEEAAEEEAAKSGSGSGSASGSGSGSGSGSD